MSFARTLSKFAFQRQLAVAERLGKNAGRIALHPLPIEGGKKGVWQQPLLRVLGLEGAHAMLNFLLAYLGLKWDEDAWLSDVSVILWSLVL